MLVVGRKIGERIVIGDRIVVAVMEIHRGRVQLGVSAPAAMPIHREEIWKRIRHSLARQEEDFDRTATLSALSKDVDEAGVANTRFIPGTAAHAACEHEYFD